MGRDGRERQDSDAVPLGLEDDLEVPDLLREGEMELPQLPGSDAFDSFLVDWMATDSFTEGSFPHEQLTDYTQPSRSAAEGYLVEPVGSSSPQAEQSTGDAGESLLPTSQEPPSAGRYSLRPRSARAREGLLEQARSRGGDDASSEAGSEESEDSRPNSGKRLTSRARSLAGRGVAVMSGSMQAVMGAAKGGVSGLTGKMSNKRSRDPEVIKEKEKARNRRAQKAFRERQKAMQEQRSQSMRRLKLHMDVLARENAQLQSKLRELEQLEQSKMEAVAQIGQSDLHSQPVVEYDDIVRLTLDTENPTEMTVQEVKALSRENLVAIYKDYIDAFQVLLTHLGDDSDSPEHQRIEELVKEIAHLLQTYAATNTCGWMRFQNSQLTEEGPSFAKPPPEHWRKVLEAMQITDEQAAEMLQHRRTTLAKLRVILKQRTELLQLQVDNLQPLKSHSVSAKDVSLAHQKAVEASWDLLTNLKEEQSVILQSLSTAQQQISTPKQKAIKIAQSWPFYPDNLSLASQLARQRGERSTAELLGVASLPPLALMPTNQSPQQVVSQ